MSGAVANLSRLDIRLDIIGLVCIGDGIQVGGLKDRFFSGLASVRFPEGILEGVDVSAG